MALAALGGCKPLQPPGAPAARFVSTAPSLTEIVFAVGAGPQLVGRSDVCDYPPAVTNVPVVGGFGTPRPEAVIAARATDLLATDWIERAAFEALERRGVRAHEFPCARLRDIPAACRRIGALTGRAAAGEALASRIERGIAAAGQAAAASGPRPRVLVLFSLDRPVTVGRDTFIDDLLRLAGCENAAASLASGYAPFSLEWLARADPDRILCLFMAADPRNVREVLSARIGWSSLRAVRAGAIDVPGDYNLIVRPGPRVLDGLGELRRLTHRP